MATDPELLRHKEWLGFLQPVGLVVSPPALVKAQAIVNRNVVGLQQSLLSAISRDLQLVDDSRAWIFDFQMFVVDVLGWESSDLISSDALRELEVALPDYGEILAPSYGVQDSDGWLMLIQVIAPGANLDEVNSADEKTGKWAASPQAKFERLLREAGVPIGILCNGTDIRLVYAPKGESSGHLTFPVQAMCEVSGRLILGAMEMLLSAYRVFTAPTGRRLKDLLEESRKYQAEVSTALANQVVDALWELLRGFQMADAAVNGRLLGELASQNPQHIYGGLITTLMRLVFLLYAEDEGLMPGDDLYQRNYAVSGLFERLRSDAGNYPDTMDQRYGAWAWLLSLFRLVYDGGGETPEYLPARHGQLFDPDEYAFLEGRGNSEQGIGDSDQWAVNSGGNSGQTNHSPLLTNHSSLPTPHSRLPTPLCPNVPRIPDGVVYRMLDRLLMLNGERLSYRSLGVSEIGSVYTAIMGFAIERAEGTSIAVRPQDVVVNVETLLAAKPGDRAKLLQNWAACKVAGKALNELKAAKTATDVVAALGRKVSPRTPNLLPAGSLYLQPGEERRRTGSHYTPRSLTEPIVETALRPVLAALGDKPTAEQILSLKVADIAMGSGAFLVEACRQLADQVETAWNRDGLPEDLPEGEEPLLYARRLVAQRCLYGVDKNPFAVNLAKLSLWLFTLSKSMPFTFLDHSLKCGDSLVGVKRREILQFSQKAFYEPTLDEYQRRLKAEAEAETTSRILKTRQKIQNADTQTDADEDAKRRYLQESEDLLRRSRLAADLMVSAFFEGTNAKQRAAKLEQFLAKLKIYDAEGLDVNPAREGLVADAMIQAELEGRTRKQRQQKQQEYSSKLIGYEAGWVNASELWQISERLRMGKHAVVPFNWEDEFLEVFERENPGFDCIIGNPPFAGKNTIISGNAENYLLWLKEYYPESHGNSDLVAYFFRKSHELLREGGSFGLIATNTIAQGDTRSTGLRWICEHGGTIYNARKRVKWVGQAAVVVSVIHIYKGLYKEAKFLDGKEVPLISAFLFPKGGNNNPNTLLANANKSFQGSIVLGMGFTFDDTNEDATPIAEMHRLIEKDRRNQECIFPYIGGEEVNSSPTHSHHRYVINFGEMSEAEARKHPDLMAIVEEKVKPTRIALPPKNSWNKTVAAKWWLFGADRVELRKAIAECDRVLVISRISKSCAFTFLPKGMVYNEKTVVFPFDTYPPFAILQSRIHEIWTRFFSSTLKDDLQYTPSDCFETFPFPRVISDQGIVNSKEGNSDQGIVNSEEGNSDQGIVNSKEHSPLSTHPLSTLEAIGKQYYDFRADLMVRNNEGLTQTYNRFHDPNEFDPDILKLRQLHDEMDRAVLAAYGWDDIQPQCEFLLDYEDEDEVDSDQWAVNSDQWAVNSDQWAVNSRQTNHSSLTTNHSSRRKKPYRYRWNEATHDEVLARLLDLNQQRYEQELLGGKQAEKKGRSKGTKTGKSGRSNTPPLPGLEA
ncbi:Eco57I restriction-modification methylase domain-containing protein [Thermocoleostomius sinensis]|uniref:site-specific DNA-methyltransferase (adenine-specific) n=1 Tax=Thermocoleostomius sinensis A174 TaxID=2016057 RepID=A0A9E9CA65_9CYAN|nr:DNA methyltransferase [Thermocoleostomius sinensis]WAL62463.1 N-6 DNA methylase [Thermocoleostomius sinensis A174]